MTNIIVPKTPSTNIWVPGARGRQAVIDSNEINLEDSESTNQAKLEYYIAKQVGVRLEKEYPGREWGVRPDLTGGIVEIFCLALSGKHAYLLHMNGSIHDLIEKALRAAGEILERYGVTRNKKYDIDITEAFDRDHNGDVIGGDHA